MRLLGVVLAGGASRRFGGDKAVALLDGRPLLDHVAAALGGSCETVVVAGRDWPGFARVSDLPAPGLGPLGGLAGALAYAAAHGFDAVLTSGCDLPRLPPDIVALLGAPDALLIDQPTIGLWRARHAQALRGFVETDARRSIRGWADAVGARQVRGPPIANVNTVTDLAALQRTAGPVTPPARPRSSR